MRIIAGQYGGRRLKSLPGRDVRPTSDKVRGAIFNALAAQGVLEGARVLDLFAGTGALGLEALSRGAAHALFLDISKASLAIARENAGLLSVHSKCEFMIKDASKLEPLCTGIESYDLIFLDPPYRKNLVEPVISRLKNGGWLASSAWIVVESEVLPHQNWHASFAAHGAKIYGKTQVTYLVYQPVQMPE